MRDRDLVRLYWPKELRSAFDALFDIDDAMGTVVARATEPTLAAIKLAWWRERLEDLDQDKAPAEPRLRAAVAELLPRGISGAELATLEDGWAALLDEDISLERITKAGAQLFALGAKLLGQSHSLLDAAGSLYGHQRAARRGLLPPMKGPGEISAHVVPRALRPLTALAALAIRDAQGGASEPEATPGRALALLKHRLTGRLPVHS